MRRSPVRPTGQRGRARAVLLTLVAVATATVGCVPVRYATPTRQAPTPAAQAILERQSDLARRIAALGPDVDPTEAQTVARVALTYPMELASQYRLTRPPITHNMLVNIGIKPRGLCIHWTEDLLRRLGTLDLETLDLYWGVAYPTRPFRLEHSTPVVTARGQPFEQGILLDAWRDSGTLFYAEVGDDERYAWEQLHNPITDYPPEPDG